MVLEEVADEGEQGWAVSDCSSYTNNLSRRETYTRGVCVCVCVWGGGGGGGGCGC